MRKFTLLLTMLALMSGIPVVKADGARLRGDASTTASGQIVVGKNTHTTHDSPFRLNYNNSQTEIIYTPDMLGGIAPGTIINSLSLSGYKYAYTNNKIDAHLTIRMENTTATTPQTTDFYTSDAMTTVFDETVHIAEVVGNSQNHEPIIAVTFTTPFVYTGENLRVTMQSLAADNSLTEFEVDGSITDKCAIRFATGTLNGALEFKPLPVTAFGFTNMDEKTVGNPMGTTNMVPSSLGYKNSDSEIIYKANDLGLANGTLVRGITFKGYKNSDPLNTTVEVWMENTTDTLPDKAAPRSTDEMTRVHIATVHIPAVVGAQDDLQPIYDFTFPSAFVYTGENLRVVVKARSDSYASTYFELDAALDRQAIYRRSDNPFADGHQYSRTDAPVAHLHIDKAISQMSGTVTSEGTALADATVKVVAGMVNYESTTDSTGKYIFPVYQDDKEYTLTVSKRGYLAHTETVVFNGTSVTKDIALARNEGFEVVESKIPTEGEVNTTYTATVILFNGAPKAADSYTAQLMVGDDIVINAETPALGESEERAFIFTFVPHTADTLDAFVRFTYGDGLVQTQSVVLTISAEKANAETLVGEPNFTDLSGPIATNSSFSRTEIIYPKSLINLAAGTRIEAIRFYGHHDASESVVTLNAWMANVAENTPLQGLSDTGLTQIADNQTIEMGQDIPNTAHEPVIEITIPDGFIYTGGDIRMLLDAVTDNGWEMIYFEIDENINNQAQQASDNFPLSEESDTNLIDLPVAHFVLSPYHTLSGTVKSDKGAMVEGANITLTSAYNVEYYATTDTEGAFSVQVIKYGKDYTLSVQHPDYAPYTHADTLSLAAGDINGLTITLKKDIGSSIISSADTRLRIYGTVDAIIVESSSKATIRIYNATGLLLRKAEVGEGTTHIGGLPLGIYLVNGVKVIVE